MAHLYVSTDACEAEALIGDTELNQEPRYKYSEIDISDGIKIAKRIGFNPMSSVEFDGKTSDKTIDSIAVDLAKQGLFVAVESDGAIKSLYAPSDIEFRDEITKLLMQPEKWDLHRPVLERTLGRMYTPSVFLMRYSNKPDQIITKIDGTNLI